jgi:hypothetical protein
MKLSALLARGKGRDFYDAIFLWQQTSPDYDFLQQRCGIGTPDKLKSALIKKISETKIEEKHRDFEHQHGTDRLRAVVQLNHIIVS